MELQRTRTEGLVGARRTAVAAAIRRWSAIAAWTTPYLADGIEALRAEGEHAPDELIAHLSPVAWEPVNFLGRYTFDPRNVRPLDDRRPLRRGSDESEEAA